MNALPKPGDRVRVTGLMNDPYPLKVGSEGTVTKINSTSDGHQIEVDWDSGRNLYLLDCDPFIVLS